jgi:hypothetical protein
MGILHVAVQAIHADIVHHGTHEGAVAKTAERIVGAGGRGGDARCQQQRHARREKTASKAHAIPRRFC